MRAKAIGYAMQGLVKYHGLKDWALRIPFHDSISANVDSIWTKTEVEFGDFERDSLTINGVEADSRALERCLAVIDHLRRLKGIDLRVRIRSENNLSGAKGLGYSSSAGAALTLAAYKALGLDEELGLDLKLLSRIARRFAGSSCRSIVGGYARWYSGTGDEDSYAVRFASREDLDVAMLIVPLKSSIKTEDAHRDAPTSPFFEARIRSAQRRADELERAIKDGDFERFGELVEQDTMELHAVTMTGSSRLLVYRPESLMVIEEVLKLRREGIKAYYSMQTGPSVFVNTYPELLDEVKSRIEALGLRCLSGRVSGGAELLSD